MANDDQHWVEERLQILKQSTQEVPDVEDALARVKARAAKPPRLSISFPGRALRWVAGLVTLCFGIIAASTMSARAQRAGATYAVELDQAYVEIGNNDPEKVWSRRWLRIRTDGSHELIQPLGHVLSFITTTRVVSPDGQVETFLDLLPIARRGNPEVPAAAKVAAGCVLPGSPNIVIGRERLHGYETVKTRFSLHGGHVTTWFALELGCEELQMRVEALQSDGSLRPVFEMRTLSVRKQ